MGFKLYFGRPFIYFQFASILSTISPKLTYYHLIQPKSPLRSRFHLRKHFSTQKMHYTTKTMFNLNSHVHFNNIQLSQNRARFYENHFKLFSMTEIYSHFRIRSLITIAPLEWISFYSNMKALKIIFYKRKKFKYKIFKRF